MFSTVGFSIKMIVLTTIFMSDMKRLMMAFTSFLLTPTSKYSKWCGSSTWVVILCISHCVVSKGSDIYIYVISAL